MLISKLKIVAVAIVALAGTAGMPAEDRSWHLFTQSFSGTVSLLHGLTKDECDKARMMAMGWALNSLPGQMTTMQPGITTKAECFQ